MAKIGDHALGNWGKAYVTERTKAMPKNSLFGSVLEKKTQDDYLNMGEIDVERRKQQELEKRLPRKRHIPTRLRDKLPGPEVIEHTKEQISNQRARTENIAKYIQSAQERALYFNKGHPITKPDIGPSTSIREPWITENDVIGAKEINDLGLNEYNNYDRDRYRVKPPVHQYALIGDVLRTGMDFTGKRYTPSVGSRSRTYRRRQTPHTSSCAGYQGGIVLDQTPSRIEVAGKEVPENIKHKFGTKICAQVLKDNNKVIDTINEQDRLKLAAHRAYHRQEIRQMPLVDHPDYRDLGNSLRSNILPGFHFHNPTLAKDTYTQAVFDNRFQDPDKFRYQRDELGTWAEQDVLRDRMKKAWVEYTTERQTKNAV